MTWTANNGTTFNKIAFNPLATNVIFIDSSSNLTDSLAMTNHSANPVALSSLTTSAFTAVDFSPNGKYIATGGTGRILYIYDSTRTPVARWDTTAQIRAIAFSRNNPNQRLFVGDSTG
jgi:WD40 repeat protein